MISVILGAMNALGLSLFDKLLCVLEEKYCRRYSFYREDNLLLKPENSAMKIFKLLSVIEFQVG